MLEGADADDEAIEVDILRLLIECSKRRHLGKALEHVDLTELGCDQSPIPRSREGEDRAPIEQFAVHVARRYPQAFTVRPPTSTKRTSASISRASSCRSRTESGGVNSSVRFR